MAEKKYFDIVSIISCIVCYFAHIVMKTLLLEVFSSVLHVNLNRKVFKRITLQLATFIIMFYIKNWFLPRDDYRKVLIEVTMICTFSAIELWAKEPPTSKTKNK